MNIKKNVINVFTICIICICFSNVAIAYTEGDSIKSYQLQKMDKIQTDIFELEKSIQELKQDEKGKYIDKQIEDIKADLKELKNDMMSKNTCSLWLEFLGIVVTLLGASVVGSAMFMKNIIDWRLKRILDCKSGELNKWLESNEYETIKKKETKLLVVSNTQSSKNKMKLVLNNIFDENNIEYKLLSDVESSNFEEFCELKDVIFFDNSEKYDSDIKVKEGFEKIKEFAEKIHEVNKSKNKNICIFYFNENGARMDTPIGFKNMNFANSESTIYSNIMDLLKYKDKVLEANKKQI